MVNLNLADKNEKVLTETTSNPTEKLWRNVLKQAFEDAFLGAKLHLCNYERQDARDFVSKRSTNFDTVCEMAGLSPDYVWDKVQQFRKEKYVWKNDLQRVQW